MTLYLVATPIGNLGDISLRAIETLRAVDCIASEDTRKTGMLLAKYEIKKPQIAFQEHNEQRVGEKIAAMLIAGQSVALVTDAGTPGISDPGFTLVRRALEANIEISMIPGPTALIMALVLSGLPVHSFTFRGFPRAKVGHAAVFSRLIKPRRIRSFSMKAPIGCAIFWMTRSPFMEIGVRLSPMTLPKNLSAWIVVHSANCVQPSLRMNRAGNIAWLSRVRVFAGR